MHALLLTWDLSASQPASLAELRKHVAEESWAKYRDAAGLVEKTWFSDEQAMVFGAFCLLETTAALEHELAAMHGIEERTGVKPKVQRFEVEAIQEGRHSVSNRLAVGKAWSPAPGKLLDAHATGVAAGLRAR
jgi:hypothetical protein